MIPREVDVIVVGVGTAGAATAQLCAERGLRVVALDRRPLEEAGARWINGVPRWAFTEAGVGAPRPPELRVADRQDFHLVAGRGPRRVRLADHGVLDVDMRRLVARLHDQARRAGAILEGGVTVQRVDGRRVSTSAGELRAEVIVDASGERGARLLQQPPTPAPDLCTAAQWVHRVVDEGAARDFFARHGVEPGQTLCFSAIAGGYSILNVKMHGGEVDILTGSLPAAGHASGRQIVDDFLRDNPWVGERRFGGQRVIPLGRPRDEIARGSVALVGDSARQVFSAHGSGIGAGLVAARMVAEAIASGAGPEGYAVAWQRRYGGVFAAFDLFRRFSEDLTPADVETLIDAGVMDETLVGAALAQRLPRLPLREIPARLSGVGRARAFSQPLARLGARIAATMALYAAYPVDRRRRGPWARLARRVAGGVG